MKIKSFEIEGLIEIIPSVFTDERGYFFESYNNDLFKSIGINDTFVQDNQSFSKKGVVRGLHFQKPPFAQGKLVRVIIGKVLDVVVDLRANSQTFLKHTVVELDATINNMFYIPPGFAHGFVTLEDSIFSYKCTNVYNKIAESGILWNDNQLNIDWQIANPIVSDKDMILQTVDEYLKNDLVF
jgi:dTDP-4-dehydrorhamnose 3,5-epimerase